MQHAALYSYDAHEVLRVSRRGNVSLYLLIVGNDTNVVYTLVCKVLHLFYKPGDVAGAADRGESPRDPNKNNLQPTTQLHYSTPLMSMNMNTNTNMNMLMLMLMLSGATGLEMSARESLCSS